MNRPMLGTWTLCGLLGAATIASAQYPYQNQYAPQQYQQRQTPPVSPYLNLFQNNLPGVNYYNYVRPNLQPPPMQQMPYQSLASSFQPEDIGLDPHDPLSRLPRATGHPTAFMNYQSYFNSSGTIGVPMQRPAAATRPTAPAAGRR